jgi:hypothetical protein
MASAWISWRSAGKREAIFEIARQKFVSIYGDARGGSQRISPDCLGRQREVSIRTQERAGGGRFVDWLRSQAIR